MIEQDINYQQLLQHYCDLNEVPYHSSRDSVVDYMLRHPSHHIQYQTPYGRVFILLSQLMRGDIDLATMMNTGDITHPLSQGLVSPHDDCLVIDASLTTPTGYQTIITIS